MQRILRIATSLDAVTQRIIRLLILTMMMTVHMSQVPAVMTTLRSSRNVMTRKFLEQTRCDWAPVGYDSLTRVPDTV